MALLRGAGAAVMSFITGLIVIISCVVAIALTINLEAGRARRRADDADRDGEGG